MIIKNYYRIRCSTEDDYIYGWDTTIPSECPNDSNHIIDPEFITCIAQRGLKSKCIELKNTKINSKNYKNVALFSYKGKSNISDITSFSFIIKKGSISSYDIMIIDRTHNKIISEDTHYIDGTLVIDNLTNIPNEYSIIMINIKKNGGGGGNLYIESLDYNY